MPFAAALSTTADPTQALEEIFKAARVFVEGPLNAGHKPDLAFVFFSPHHAGAAATLAGKLMEIAQPRCLLGCIGESIVSNKHEVEREPAISLWLGSFGRRVELDPFHLMLEQTADGPSLLGFPDSLVGANLGDTAMLLLGDPFTFPINEFLPQMNEDHRGLRVMGGMASGIRGPGQCRLILGERVMDQGAVGVVLHGAGLVRSIVSQGCRPVGRHMVITGGHDNIITQLGGRSAFEQLQQLWNELSPRDQQLFQRGPHVGLVMNEYQGEFRRGDFLVRNVIGVERETGAMAITDRVRVGQTVQFHLRDAEAADEDLRALLQQDRQAHGERPAGALLFTCNGRGTNLFAEPNHDAGLLWAERGPLATAGFFAQGELGPVGGQNFIHGFTASVVLFEE